MKRQIIHLILIVLCSGKVVFAAENEPEAIAEVLTKQAIYIYDDDFNEVAAIKSSNFNKEFNAVETSEGEIQGIMIEDFNKAEGMFAIHIKGFDSRVWVESYAFRTVPGREVECSKSIMGLANETQSNATVGFGGCGEKTD